MSALLLPFAKRLSDEQFVSPEEVARGLACNCVCPACEHPVQAKQGTEKAWHFAHAISSNCANAYEISVHELAKQLLKDQKKLLVPDLIVAESAWDALGVQHYEEETVFKAKTVALEACQSGKTVNDVAPDLLGTLNGRKVIIEVTVFHRLMPDKRERIEKTGLAAMEIDLGKFKSIQASRELLEVELFQNPKNRRWICHPRQAEVIEQLRIKLQVKLEASNVKAAALAEARAKQVVLATQRKAELDARHLVPAKLVQQRDASSAWWAPRGTPQHVADEWLEWRASFPAVERWQPAREAFGLRHVIPQDRLDEVMGSISKRSHLAETTPQKLAAEWATSLRVNAKDVCQYFREAGYTLD